MSSPGHRAVETMMSLLRETLEETAPSLPKTVPPPPSDTYAQDLLKTAEEYERRASRLLARAADLRLVAKKAPGEIQES